MARAIHNRYPYERPPGRPEGAEAPASLPFDYAAAVPIAGRPGAVHEAVINISPEGPFTAFAISYGFEQDRGQAIGPLVLPSRDPVVPGDLPLKAFPIDVLLDGLRVGPRYLPIVFETRAAAGGIETTGRFSTTLVSPDVLDATPVFERVQPPALIEFFFTLIDTASGRELQDQPAFNISSLGDAAGRRPFRTLPAPVHFGPRSTIRVQIIERTDGVAGTLFLNLIGVQATSSCAPAMPPPPPGDRRVIPFDYVSRVSLTGQPGNRIEDEVAINAEGGFFVSNIGYGLQTDDPAVQISVPAAASTVDLGGVRLRDLPANALIDGFRIAPGFLRFAITPDGNLNPALPTALAGRVLENLNLPESVSFRFTLFDSGAGRDLQNQPINNIAGLGSATGERPFKRLAVPLRFLPRSTFRLAVDEHFGRGELYFVLQGFKFLQGFAMGGRA